MPFRIRSNNPIVRIISAVGAAMAWWAVMAASLLIVIPFFGTFDTQAFLTGTEPKDDPQITDFEFILALAIMLGVDFLFRLLFKRLSRYINRKMNKKIVWDSNPMG